MSKTVATSRTVTAKPCTALPAALLARTVTGAASSAVPVGMVTSPEPASIVAPAGAATRA